MAIVSYGRALTLHAEQDSRRVAIVWDGQETTCRTLDRRSNQLARAYAERGVGTGDFVTIALPNSVEFLEACFATWKLGAIPQPISARLPEKERHAIVAQARPRLVVGVEPNAHADVPTLLAGFDASSFADDALEDRTAPNRQALASGGSTGQPKLIVDALTAECDTQEPFYGIEPGITVLVPGPMYHAGPFINAVVTLLMGGRIILMSRFDPASALALIAQHRVQWVNFVPTMLHRIWRLPEAERARHDLSSIEKVFSSGAACPAWLKREWIDWLGPERIFEAYGATERIGGTMITGSEWLEHPGSVGKPTHGREIRILDDTGKMLPPGEVGEVFMMPPGGQGSTYQYIGAQARANEDGWESLGDLGYLDEEGYLYLVDRRTDMIVTGGHNVYPAEVEAALEAHPSVQSCAVIGLPEDDLGQRVHAIVEARPPVAADTLREHLAAHLVRYKVPRSFEFVDTSLRDDAGKLRRSALREARVHQMSGSEGQSST